jgi:hypothetical protein
MEKKIISFGWKRVFIVRKSVGDNDQPVSVILS